MDRRENKWTLDKHIPVSVLLALVIQTGTIAAVAVAFARFTAVFFPALSADVFLGTTINLGSGPIEVGLSPVRT